MGLPQGGLTTSALLAEYRSLDDKEADLIRQIKAYESVFLGLVGEISSHLAQRREDAPTDYEKDRHNRAEPERWLAIGETHLQQAAMALVRAVAQPEPLYRGPLPP